MWSLRANLEQRQTLTKEFHPLRLPDTHQEVLKLKPLPAHCHCLTQGLPITHVLMF